MNDRRPPGGGPEGAVEAELRRRERAETGRNAGPAGTPRQSPGAGSGGPGSPWPDGYRAVNLKVICGCIEWMIGDMKGSIISEEDNVAEQVRPVAQVGDYLCQG